ncbi:MAG: helix-turn-helix domain-containing protein [Nocardioidaceae bacterium]
MIRTSPEELTTTQAAQELGISRPTLMKMIRNGEIPAHKVGTNTHLRKAAVRVKRHERLTARRQALAELMELCDDLGEMEDLASRALDRRATPIPTDAGV